VSDRIETVLGDVAASVAVLTQKAVLEKIPHVFKRLEEIAESVFSYELPPVPVARRLMDLSLNISRQHPDIIFGIGGGTVLDSAKYVSYLLNLPLILVPTLASNDGICSPVASLFLEEDQRSSIRTKMPYAVLADKDIILSSPARYTMAGVGDIISKACALEDWKLSNETTGEEIDYFAWTLSKMAYHSVLHFKDPSLNNKEFIDTLLESLVSSGIAIEYAGNSRPASGAEHLLSHAVDRLLGYSGIHGLQAGFYTCTVLMARDSINYGVVTEFLGNIGFFNHIPRQLFNRELFERALELAPHVRRRFTCLDIICPQVLKFAFEETCKHIDRFLSRDSSENGT